MKIAVVGIGYVGLSSAVLLSQKYQVIAYDIDSSRVEKLNNKISPIVDSEIENFLQTKKLKLSATSNIKKAIGDKKGLAISYNNFGIIHGQLGDFSKSLESYNKAIEIEKELAAPPTSILDIYRASILALFEKAMLKAFILLSFLLR